MIFIRRDGQGISRFLSLRVGLFFFAAGLWFAGVLTDNMVITAVALGVAAVAVVLGFISRSPPAEEEEEEPDDEGPG